MRLRGSVTLFLALILTSCCALICALLESARTAGVRCYAALALDAATDSLFSRYDGSLWEQYRILAYRYPGDTRCTALLSETVNTYRENAGRYAFFDAEIGLPEKTFLGDGGGVWLEEELLAYMKEKPETDFPLTPEMLLLHTAELRRAERNSPVMPALSRLCAEAAECEASYFQTEQALLLAAAEKEAAASALSSGDLADFGAHSAALQAAIETSERSAERCLEAGLRFESAEASLRETEAETADELSPIRDVLSESGENYRAERPELTALVSAAPALSQTLSAKPRMTMRTARASMLCPSGRNLPLNLRQNSLSRPSPSHRVSYGMPRSLPCRSFFAYRPRAARHSVSRQPQRSPRGNLRSALRFPQHSRILSRERRATSKNSARSRPMRQPFSPAFSL